eukprot:PhF_6_TR36174/c1_g3_i8/m.52691
MNATFDHKPKTPHTSGRRPQLRHATVARKDVQMYWTKATRVASTVCVRAVQPVLATTLYIPPYDNAEDLVAFDTHMEDIEVQFPGIPHVLLGDVNATTNRKAMLRIKRLGFCDITPQNPNFTRGDSSGTRPSRVLVKNGMTGLVSSVETINVDTLSDGHRPVRIKIQLYECKGRTVSSYSTRLHDISELQQTRPPLTEARKETLISDIGYMDLLRAGNDTRRHRRRLRNWGIHPPSVREIQKKANAQDHMKAVSLKDALLSDRRRGGPGMIRVAGRNTSNFDDIEKSMRDHFEQLWGEPTQTTFEPMEVMSPSQRELNKSIMTAPITEEEVAVVLQQLKPKAVCADFKAGRLLKDLNPEDTKRLTDTLNKPIPSVHVLVALVPKEEGILPPEKHRGISCPPLLFKLKRMVQAVRAKAILNSFGVLHSSNFSFRTGRSIQQVLTCLSAFLDINPRGKYMVGSADAIKAYDYVSHVVADKILERYGLLTPETSYCLRTFLATLVLGEGLSKTILVKRGLPQGDLVSCTTFTLVTDYVLRLMPSIPRIPITAGVVDDFVFVSLVEEGEAILDELRQAWGALGIGVSKIRAITASDCTTIPNFVQARHGRVLGACIHLDDCHFCDRASLVEQDLINKIDMIEAFVPWELDRVKATEMFVASKVAFFPDECTRVENIQKRLYGVIKRGIGNPNITLKKGFNESQTCPRRMGGRGIPDITKIRAVSLLNSISSLVTVCYDPKKFIIPSMQGCGPFGKRIKQSMKDLEIHWCDDPRPGVGCVRAVCDQIGSHTLSGDVIAVDASFDRKSNSAVIGLASPENDGSITIGIEGFVGSSYEAELCGIAIAAGLKPTKILNDNKSAVDTILGLAKPTGGGTYGLVQTVKSLMTGINLQWVRGHQDESEHADHKANVKADLATKQNPTFFMPRAQMDTTYHGSFVDTYGGTTTDLSWQWKQMTRGQWSGDVVNTRVNAKRSVEWRRCQHACERKEVSGVETL